VNRLGLLVVGLCAGVASAQAVGPKVAPFPLNIRSAPGEFSDKPKNELQAEYRRLLRDLGVPSPSTYDIKEALLRTRRQDCETEDGCLVALALTSDCLYGLYVEVSWDLKDTVTAAGRVVRSDGVVAAPTRKVTQKIGKKEGFGGAAKEALRKLLVDELGVTKLPTARAVVEEPLKTTPAVTPDAGVASVPVAPVDAGVTDFLPPPPPPVLEPSPLKTVGWVTAAVGGAAVITGGILVGAAASNVRVVDMGRIVPREGETAESAAAAYTSARTLQPVGVGLLLGGAALATGGLLLGLLVPDVAKVSFTPLPGGGAVVGFGGEMP
jgi:hypothetical protein